ncbi:OLC1v1004328C3 [Oldenlandia corymbosa var. corymbosa]|uniref:Poly [ADP-ribose] polymerase n=1 Tax=Oldenlandia corymbosa var. corymbosa TaxID=529605 RepID=A0AAV1DCQ3_OLDCO|nr:OLC1v1004328C3 [Oldenlandia corymbosa var. corymbosa]
MATQQLKVDELRSELSKRGLSTTGTKPTLVRRLEAAIKAEEEEEKDVKKTSRKRQRDDEGSGVSDHGSQKLKPTEEDLKKMSVKELREQANLQGVLATGSKKELLERLISDADGNPAKTDKEEEKEEKKQKQVTATKKGAAVLDQCIPDEIKSTYHVLQQGDDIYDATLNQTNVGDNNNKFYIIQVLESDAGGRFMVFNRWGRVGSKGQNKLSGPYTSKEEAIDEFVSKFHGKTKNYWHHRHEFVAHPKSYTWLEMDYNETGQESVQETSAPKRDVQPRETQLEARVAKFISLICSISMMKQQMLEIGYNAEKLPLGKLSKSTILKGYDVLKRIADVIGQSNRTTLEQLSGEFYTVIPHDFGYKKMREFVIDTPQKLKAKLEMVEALGEIEVATKLLEDVNSMEEDSLYYQYQRLHCELNPIEVGSDEYIMIEKYMKNTHAKTHSNYSVDIVQVFRASREGEAERFNKFSTTGNRMLLWHGSRLTNWAGILSQGLRIAPPEAPVTGYMFGKGVYFADMFSKSANYCYTSHSATAGVLLLCEVALGDMVELVNADYNADKLPQGKLSTKGVGQTAPDLSEAQVLDDNVIVPLGRPKEQRSTRASLLYNEYIVYNVEQIKMRYILHMLVLPFELGWSLLRFI